MLVAVRAFEPAEVKAALGPSAVLERYYSLQPDGLGATLVDVTDHRARKTIRYDALTQSNAELVQSILVPFTVAITEPQQACQAAVVVDGLAATRRSVLFGAADGMVQSALVLLRQQPSVDSIFLSAVSLADGNQLEDLLIPPGQAESDGPTIMEDTRDMFTSIESAHYEELTSDSEVQRLLAFLGSRVSATRHQVYSIIVTFTDPNVMPNTTMQFVSLAVNEVAREMKSTRHCLSTAAALIESHAPVQSFSGTKLSFLLKPMLLGQQPGAYVGCFCPISPVTPEQERETFKEAFCVAQTLSRVFDSRDGLFTTSPPALVRSQPEVVAWKRAPGRQSSAPQRRSPPTAPDHTDDTGGLSPLPQNPSTRGGARGGACDTQWGTPTEQEAPAVHSKPQPRASSIERRLRELEQENRQLRDQQRERKEEVPKVRDGEPSTRSGSSLSHSAAPESSPHLTDLHLLLEMIQQQQAEIKQHVAHEERYRQRILELEESLRTRTEQVTLLTGELRATIGGGDDIDETGRQRIANTSAQVEPPPLQALQRLQDELDRERERRVRAELSVAEHSRNAVEDVRSAFASQIAELQNELNYFRTQFSAIQDQSGPLPTAPSVPRSSRQRLVSPHVEAVPRSPRSAPHPSSSARKSRGGGVPSYDDFMRDDPQYRMRHSSTPRQRRT